MKISLTLVVVLLVACLAGVAGADASLDAHVAVLKNSGSEPLAFVRKTLKTHDLIIFDDALHSAQEPFDFYQKLLRDPEIQELSPYVFVEVFSLTAQPQLDAYFAAESRDPGLLMKVFQDDYSGYGWRYQTYLDLLSAIWDINRKLPAQKRIKVVGVDQPIYWEAIHTKQDYEIFQDSLLARDYFLYSVIVEKLDRFASGKKGLFLTNTRHSYKHLRRANGQLHWNCATFFDQLYPGKTYSVRFHNVILNVEARSPQTGTRTAEGMEEVKYSWVRMENGLWDRAFREAGNQPVAVPLRDNVFGRARYAGNLMLDVREDQTLYDVYDAVVFLAPLEELHVSAEFGFIYTGAFRKEVKRRIELMQEGNLDTFLKENGVKTVDDLIEILAAGEPQKRNPYAANLP